MRPLARSLVVAVFCALLATSAAAQSTGSSFGGGSWGGSSGGSSGSSGSSGSGASGGSAYSGVSYDDPNAYEPPFGVQCLIAVGFLGLLFLGFRMLARLQRPPPVDVASARIAVDARARAFLQAKLRELGQRGDTATPEGRAALLKATCDALRASELAWIYAHAESFRPMPSPEAQSTFQRLANDARAGFQHELERSADGKRSTETLAAAPVAREHEGAGAVLVTVLVAARRELVDVRTTKASELSALLGQLGALKPHELVALEVVWTPSAEDDRMSTDELEARYPMLTKLEGAVGGRVFCRSCRGPHAAELAKCPHCGAPTG